MVNQYRYYQNSFRLFIAYVRVPQRTFLECVRRLPRDLGNAVNTNVTASIQVNDVTNILVYVKVGALVVGRGITAKSVSFCMS